MLEKILGGLYGQAMGDAWAMPSMLTLEENKQIYNGWLDDFRPAPKEHPVHAGLRAGEVTDDTQQAFALAGAIISDGRVTLEGTIKALLDWYDRVGGDSCRFIGPSSRKAIQALKRGEDVYKTGLYNDTNGCAMRISPVGMIHPGDIEGTVNDAYITCIPTHHTNVAVSGASAVAGAIAVAMQPGVPLEEVINGGIQAAEMGRSLGPRWMGASVSLRIEMAVKIARSQGTEYQRLQEIYDVIGATLAVTEAVPAAFGILAMAGGDPKQTAIYAAALSGDADTIGAMACAIAGTWRGLTMIPYQYILKLRKTNTELDFEGTAEKLFALSNKK